MQLCMPPNAVSKASVSILHTWPQMLCQRHQYPYFMLEPKCCVRGISIHILCLAPNAVSETFHARPQYQIPIPMWYRGSWVPGLSIPCVVGFDSSPPISPQLLWICPNYPEKASYSRLNRRGYMSTLLIVVSLNLHHQLCDISPVYMDSVATKAMFIAVHLHFNSDTAAFS